jgi:hypothetical protein
MRPLAPAAVLVAALVAACGGSSKFVADTTLVKPCVKPGEKQTITLKTTPGANYAYAITYPNQVGELQPPAGTVPPSGKVVGTWGIPTDMMDGPVKVQVLVSYRTHQVHPEVTFKVAKSGVCA